ncbi:hypothetical protein H2200_007726 [Cladophialophora chaetospira]|uniref:SnoaL-like domain-containing protein n=1 Tax=Cladophialophora chaetospira TaxID=386627 RepID=A0AA39CGV5_9EURO|nr:hypothetical protein H2200_007726 [Cladophialophora chaetospira]
MATKESAVDSVLIVKDFFSAIDQKDEPSLAALCAEDLEWIVPGEWAGAGTHRGHAGLKNLFTKAFETFDIVTSERHEFVAQGDRVIVIGLATGKSKATNKTFEDHFVFAMTVRNGKVLKVREYIDTLALDRACDTTAK